MALVRSLRFLAQAMLTSRAMRKRDFDYQLPPHLIAQQPLAERRASRLLALDGGANSLEDRQFGDLPTLLRAGDLLVFNDTKVIPARLMGEKETGGKVEVLVERVLDGQRVLAQVRASKSPKPGGRLILEGKLAVSVVARQGDMFELQFPQQSSVLELLDDCGRIPLPPYIERSADTADRQRYQTVFARRPGAVAAPTAGLHFDEPLLDQLRAQGVDVGFVTLHVGAGTFQPVRVDDLSQHHMHAEYVEVSETVCEQIDAARRRGGRVIAVGTTSVRSLEAAVCDGRVAPYRGETRLFITPGYVFKSIDGLLTNFHLPESTLLMLVCAFGGYAQVMHAYRHAVAEGYRFFSYGDAMLLWPDPAAVADRTERES